MIDERSPLDKMKERSRNKRRLLTKITYAIDHLKKQSDNGHSYHNFETYINEERFRHLRIPLGVLIEILEAKKSNVEKPSDQDWVQNLQPDEQGKSELDD